MIKITGIRLFYLSLPLCGLWLIGQGSYIHAKALLAQVLLETAWSDSVHGQTKEVKPWPWADTWPVSRLRVPSLGISRIVLAGVSGQALAFGPGHLFNSVEPGDKGNLVIAGHRDTHFKFLKEIHIGDTIVVESKTNKEFTYKVIKTDIVHKTNSTILANSAQPLIILITCYPFDSLNSGGPLRYLVTGALVEDTPQVVENDKTLMM